ncbi:hypothetical protein ACIBCA_03920 [Kitasatospora sp. NPDC051170]|uniref:hypothetical protein n=1 Tax=Kitasatospora sp. NPDC051170 TaxID=3364056 RepID=UPI0037899B0F
MKTRAVASLAGLTLAATVAAVTLASPAYADTYRGHTELAGCQATLYSTYSNGHDYVKYVASTGQWGCSVFLRTWIGPNSYDHDLTGLSPYQSASSGWYYDAGVKTQACVQLSSVDIYCTTAY